MILLTMTTQGTQSPECPGGQECSQVCSHITSSWKYKITPLLLDFDYSMACTNSYSPPGPEPMGPSYSARTVVTYQVDWRAGALKPFLACALFRQLWTVWVAIVPGISNIITWVWKGLFQCSTWLYCHWLSDVPVMVVQVEQFCHARSK